MKRIREPFGKAGLTVAILALVLAMVGGAYAAGGLTKSQEKQVAKIAKKYAGKPGAPGAAGANGTNGTPGAKGDKGDPGTNGTNGTNGKSVTLSTLAAGQEGCSAGGTKVEVEGTPASKKAVCNGKDGQTGFTETLPSGKTETGTWSIVQHGQYGSPVALTTVSFPIQLPAAGEQGKGLAFNQQETEEIEASTISPGGCKGSVEAPTAPKGVLCVYTEKEEKTETEGKFLIPTPPGKTGVEESYGKTGTYIAGPVGTHPTSFYEAFGTWAVTAP